MTDRNNTIERLRDIRDRAVVSDGMFTESAAYMVKLIDGKPISGERKE